MEHPGSDSVSGSNRRRARRPDWPSAISAAPIAFLLAGTLADNVFEPAMAEAGGIVGAVFGSGPGRGIRVMFVLAGILVLLTVFVSWNNRRIREIDTELPDLDPVGV